MSKFYERFKYVFPLKIRTRQNDNEKENVKEFEEKLRREKVRQLFSVQR